MLRLFLIGKPFAPVCTVQRIARHAQRIGGILCAGKGGAKLCEDIRRAGGEKGDAIFERIAVDEGGGKLWIHTITSRQRYTKRAYLSSGPGLACKWPFRVLFLLQNIARKKVSAGGMDAV